MLEYASASAAFTAIKQAASTTATGVVEAATTAEMSAGTASKFPDAAEVKTYVDTAVSASQPAIRQVVTAVIAAASGTTTIPLDNTSPVNTEGTQIVTANITPADSNNEVLVRASFTVDTSLNDSIIAAVFRGSTCIGAAILANTNSGETTAGVVSFNIKDAPASASAVTYSIRIGKDSGGGSLWYVNREATYTLNGEPAKTIMSLEELVV
jgi:hypothetical protein